mmetsp:Transcript_4317/g.5952  ORF Transcript_4317/g.5952 Transcript_4317/m.5952 type:complete len:170 (+) Transcript_4317:682-1191(+)
MALTNASYSNDWICFTIPPVIFRFSASILTSSVALNSLWSTNSYGAALTRVATYRCVVGPEDVLFLQSVGAGTIWLGLRLKPTAVAHKSMIWILLRRTQDPNVPGGRGLMMGQELVPHGSAASVRDFVGDVITSLVDAAVHCVVVSYMRQGQFWRQQKRFIEVEHRSPN